MAYFNGKRIAFSPRMNITHRVAMNWEYVQHLVRTGQAPEIFPVGTEFPIYHSGVGGELVWEVIAHNHHKAADETLTNTMTLQMKYLYSTILGKRSRVQYDESEAFYYTPTKLAPGTYGFMITKAGGAVTAGSYTFTITQEIPAGGQLILENPSDARTLPEMTLYSVGGVGNMEAIERGIPIAQSNVYDKWLDSSDTGHFNNTRRFLSGSNNYAQSAIRQWLNSEDTNGFTWVPQTKFDRPPDLTSDDAPLEYGFAAGFRRDFLDVVQPAVVECCTPPDYFEVNSLDGTVFTPGMNYVLHDKFFLLSRSEVYSTSESKKCVEGTQIPYYKAMSSNAERIKRDVLGNASNSLLRTAAHNTSYNARAILYNTGALGSVKATYKAGVSAVCVIA